jgi:hypothetical protein
MSEEKAVRILDALQRSRRHSQPHQASRRVVRAASEHHLERSRALGPAAEIQLKAPELERRVARWRTAGECREQLLGFRIPAAGYMRAGTEDSRLFVGGGPQEVLYLVVLAGVEGASSRHSWRVIGGRRLTGRGCGDGNQERRADSAELPPRQHRRLRCLAINCHRRSVSRHLEGT